LHGSAGSAGFVVGSGFAFASGVVDGFCALFGVVAAGFDLQAGVPSIAPANTTVRHIVWVVVSRFMWPEA
jgi:hypothetical protein